MKLQWTTDKPGTWKAEGSRSAAGGRRWWHINNLRVKAAEGQPAHEKYLVSWDGGSIRGREAMHYETLSVAKESAQVFENELGRPETPTAAPPTVSAGDPDDDDFIIETEEPPPVVAAGRGLEKHRKALRALERLRDTPIVEGKPAPWFRWTDSPKNYRGTLDTLARAVGVGVQAFVSVHDGTRVIIVRRWLKCSPGGGLQVQARAKRPS